MQCPVDQNTLRSKTVYGIETDTCTECSGMWLSGDEFKKLTQQFTTETKPEGESSAFLDRIRAPQTTTDWKAYSTVLLCPSDGSKMNTFVYGANSGIVIDSCPQCEGFWLDNEEIEKIRKFLLPDQLELAFGGAYAEEMTEIAQLRETIKSTPDELANFVRSPLYGFAVFIRFLLYRALKQEKNLPR